MCTGQIRSSRRLKASTNTPEAGKLSNGRLLHGRCHGVGGSVAEEHAEIS